MQLTTVAARRRVDKGRRVHLSDVPSRLVRTHKVDGIVVEIVQGPIVARCGSILGGRILRDDLAAVTCAECSAATPDAWRSRLRARLA